MSEMQIVDLVTSSIASLARFSILPYCTLWIRATGNIFFAALETGKVDTFWFPTQQFVCVQWYIYLNFN